MLCYPIPSCMASYNTSKCSEGVGSFSCIEFSFSVAMWLHLYRMTLCVSIIFAVGRYPSVYHVHVLYPHDWRYSLVKFLSRSRSTIILVLWPLALLPNPEGTPSSGALNTQGWGKFAIFDWNHSLPWKRYDIGNGTLIGSYISMCRIDPCRFRWPWMTWPWKAGHDGSFLSCRSPLQLSYCLT